MIQQDSCWLVCLNFSIFTVYDLINYLQSDLTRNL